MREADSAEVEVPEMKLIDEEDETVLEVEVLGDVVGFPEFWPCVFFLVSLSSRILVTMSVSERRLESDLDARELEEKVA